MCIALRLYGNSPQRKVLESIAVVGFAGCRWVLREEERHLPAILIVSALSKPVREPITLESHGLGLLRLCSQQVLYTN
jgi:hypothetical protein